jgi:hypothetical protein
MSVGSVERGSAVCGAALLLITGLASAQTQYRLTDFGSYSKVTAINAAGEVTGVAGAHDNALRDHARAQPFDVADGELLTQGDVVRGPIIDELAPDAFTDWLATLDRLAS